MATLRFVDKSLSVFVGNISTAVPHEEVEEVIYELFIQAGPLKGIKIDVGGVRENVKYPKAYGFVQFLHEESVEYASRLMNGITLYKKQIRVSPAGQQDQQTPLPLHGRPTNGIPLLHSSVNSHQVPASSLQDRPSPMLPPSAPLYAHPHPHSPQPSGSSTAQQTGPRPPYPCLSPPYGTHPLSPPNVQCTPHTPPMGYIPVGGNLRDGVFQWQQDGYPRDGLINTQMHESRAYAHDHPHWLSSEARQHLSEYHTSRLQGSFPQENHRRDRSRSTHRSRAHSPYQPPQAPPRRSYSYHGSRDGDEPIRSSSGPALLRSRSHDGNEPIMSHDSQTHRYRGRR